MENKVYFLSFTGTRAFYALMMALIVSIIISEATGICGILAVAIRKYVLQ